ncbi:MAG: TraM recognition domain-containing protein [Rubrivivax sp.]|nr:TraM recognition domain-containing protein [Rubrivivax sp.]
MHIALGYLAAGFGFLVLTSKKEECRQWVEWARLTGRLDDLVIFGPDSGLCFNFLNAEATRAGGGGGITLNIVATLMECLSAIAVDSAKSEGGGDNKWFEDATRNMLENLIDLPTFAGIPITLQLLRSIVSTAPQTPKEAHSAEWREGSVCAAILGEAEGKAREAGDAAFADFEECQRYWLKDFPALSEKTRSIIVLSFAMLVRPFITRPLAQLFSQPVSNVSPEDCCAGKIVIVDLPVQEYHLAGRLANLAWKYCFQRAVLRREPPSEPGTYLRPVVLWADEAQNFVTKFDAEYQAVARSAGGCTVYLTQNRESYRRVLGDDDAVDSLLGNLQAKFFCQNSSTGTNGWASALFGERWVELMTRTGGATGVGIGASDGRVTSNAGFSTVHQRRHFIEAAQFAMLRRGGERNGYLVDAYVYNGGERYAGTDGKEEVPFKFLTFNQRS